MQAILVANPKGGSGKTTLSTNLAGYFAARGEPVALLDLDRQKSATQWLALRDGHLPEIRLMTENQNPGEGWLVIDSPAALHGKNLEHALKLAHKVIVPVSPSLFDIRASEDFLTTLHAEKAVRRGRAYVGVVGMRVDPRTRAGATLDVFMAQQDLPVLTYLRNAQNYVNAAFEGKSLFDLPPHLVERDIAQWKALTAWLDI